jgi:hypothetical protein
VQYQTSVGVARFLAPLLLSLLHERREVKVL